jgi:hypothetical protein
MATFTKHLGVIKNTGTKVAVVFREVPDEPSNCLVIDLDKIPDSQKEAVLRVIHSDDAQKTVNLYEALEAKKEQSGISYLNVLHQLGLIKKVSVESIVMTPTGNQNVPLAYINQLENEKAAPTEEVKTVGETVVIEESVLASKSFDAYSETEKQARAQMLMDQAYRLEENAVKLREEAYLLMPAIRNILKTSRISEAEREARLEARNKRRRDRYAEKKVSN